MYKITYMQYGRMLTEKFKTLKETERFILKCKKNKEIYIDSVQEV